MLSLKLVRLAICGASLVLGAWAAHATAAWRRRCRLLLRSQQPGLKASLLARRKRDFCPAQSVSYANSDPLVIVEGTGCTLIVRPERFERPAFRSGVRF